MRVKLFNSLARMVDERLVANIGGDVIDVTTNEGTRLIATNRAVLVPDEVPAIDGPLEQAPKRVKRVPKD
jgi:hypothetical protein